MPAPFQVVVVVPVLGRPQRALPLAMSWDAAEPDEQLTRLAFVVTRDDQAQAEACAAATRWLIERPNARASTIVFADPPAGPGDFARKVNLAFRYSSEPFLFQAADDVVFHPGWATEALRVIEETQTGVCGTNDLANAKVKKGRHSTHSLIRRAYVDECGAALDGPGVVFHEGYGHQYCDNELVELASFRGCWSFAEASHVEHLHPFWHTAVDDDTYRKGRASSDDDRRLYLRRRQAWNR